MTLIPARQSGVCILQIQALNDLYRRSDGKEGYGFGKRTISGGGTWLSVEDDGQAARKTKKNMAKVRCKACGQVRPLSPFPPHLTVSH